MGLIIIRVLVLAKTLIRLVVRLLARPFAGVWRFILPRVVVPVYHALYSVRRRIQRFVRPAKNRLMYLVANRHMLHTVAIGVAVTAGIANLQLSDVRAETYGKRSTMYGLLTGDEQQLIDSYTDVTDVSDSAPVKYRTDGVLGLPYGIAAPTETTTEAASVVAGGTLSSLAIAEGGASVAPRTTVETYVVQEGDTLSTVASRYGVSLDTLLWANSMTVRTIVKPGKELTILPVSGVLHSVKSGDTIARIASSYSVEQDEILAYNSISDASSLTVGQQLIVPGGEVKAPAPTTRSQAVARYLTAPTASTPKSSETGGAMMIWPTDLTYVVRGTSWYHTGVDIDCNGHADGTSSNDNYAAMDGIVQFSGWRRGYGNTVEINHGNGLVTRYGHHHALYVQSGQSVTAGTPLGRCGSTGTSTGTHLHFEVIANGSFMNPRNYLPYKW